MAHRAGHELDALDLAPLLGASVEGGAAELSRQLGASIAAADVHDELLRGLAAVDVQALPGAAALLSALRRRGITAAVASNAPSSALRQTLIAANLHTLIDAVISIDDVRCGKPAPDPYLAACRALGHQPSDCSAFEDSAIGARSAATAGLSVVGVAPTAVTLDVDVRVESLLDPEVATVLSLRTLVPLGGS